MGRPMPGAVSVDDAVAMTRAGVDQQVIIDHIHAVGVYRPLTTDDIIYLRNNGVSNRVVQTMQHPPIASPPPAVAYDAAAADGRGRSVLRSSVIPGSTVARRRRVSA